ncbi:oligosaccharide flippase family protein [Curtobacterium sp. SGAir0471]|uniref:oligosaccharide flippase family protein n=1 Tax=Curtobacterium sp. SGAir0471 TaxID=2070337 RepID=UPI001586AAC5|nr:oligosaccharide flippase family protein [Curtobacterium sp. SGAir0471]
MSARRPITASTLVLVVGNVFPPAATFVMAPFLAHSLGVDGRGELAAVTAPFLLALSIGTFGIPDAVTQTIASGRRVARSGWWLAWLLLTVGGIAALAAVGVAAPVIVGSDTVDLTALVTVATAATTPALFVALLRGRAAGRHAWGFVTAERIIAASVKISGTLVLAAVDRLDLPAAVALVAISPIVGGLVYLFMPRATPPSGSATVVQAIPMLSFSLRSWLGSAAGVLLIRLDQLLVLPLADAEQLGLYAVAVNVAEVPSIVTNAVREVMLSSDAQEADDVRVPRVARSAFVLAVTIAVPLGISAPLWVPFVFGGAFAASVPVMAVSIVAVVIGVPGSIAGSTLTARGGPELRSMSITVGCIANIVCLVTLVPILGAVGAATAALIGNLLSSNGSVRGAARLTGARTRDFYAVRPTDARYLATETIRLVRRNLIRS